METEDLNGAQAMFALASQFIYCEPQADQIAGYAANDLFADAPFGTDDETLVQGLDEMRAWCAQAVASDDYEEQISALKSDWFQLYVGAGVPNAPSWSGFYQSPNHQLLSYETLEVRNIYQKFGLRMERVNSEPDDNLGIMMGFIAHLISLELDDVCDSMREEAFETQRKLLVKRILPWISAWHYKAVKYARTGYYLGVGNLVFGLIRAYAKRFDVRYVEESQSFVISE